jgi:hypothetical protein
VLLEKQKHLYMLTSELLYGKEWEATCRCCDLNEPDGPKQV